MQDDTFPTKKDRWLVCLIWAGAALAVAGGFAQLDSGAPGWATALVLLLLLGGAGFMLWVLHSTEYVVGREELLVRGGLLRYRVPLAEIESVTPSRDPRSSPAGSLDRLLIRWSPADRRLLVSPEPKLRFLEELSRRCPHLALRGDRLTRVGFGPAP